MADVVEKQKKLNPALDFAAGTLAGMTGLLVGHPLDTVKVRLQSPDTANKYSGTWHALRTIVKNERFSGLYKGVTSPLAGTAFLNGIVFSSYGFFIRLQLKHPEDEPSLLQVGLAGAGTGIAASIVTTPTELIKIRQQNMLSRDGLPSTLAVIRSVVHAEGLRGLYRGVTSTCLRDLGYGSYFAAYEGTCRLLRQRTPHPNAVWHDHTSLIDEIDSFEADLSWSECMLAGGVAGIAGWIFTFPFDTVKSRIQGTVWSPEGSSRHPYNNTLSALRYSYQKLGPKGLLAGLTPTLIRAIPVNMATFLVFETVVAAMKSQV